MFMYIHILFDITELENGNIRDIKCVYTKYHWCLEILTSKPQHSPKQYIGENAIISLLTTNVSICINYATGIGLCFFLNQPQTNIYLHIRLYSFNYITINN